jgi:Uma2 family endonuclease
MIKSALLLEEQGPFRADQLNPDDPYELSRGHAIHCMPTGGRGARAAGAGAKALGSDPAVVELGLDAGYSPDPGTLRAPDISVGPIRNEPGWIPGVPPLAVEYADTGQDEEQLALKIADLLAAGTQLVWVVRLTGPRRIEVHAPGKPVRLANPGERLEAPGILANPVPVEALYDPKASAEVASRNELERLGYASLDAVRAEGLRSAIHEVLTARGLTVPEDVTVAIASCQDFALLKRWVGKAVTVASAADLVAG